MRITGTGHASMRIDTAAGSILCDPWVNPAYFASWFPFPDNSLLDWETLGDVDYLYVSHLHRDHFDAEAPDASIVSKKATVLLPEYPTSQLEDELRDAGLHQLPQDEVQRGARARRRPEGDDPGADQPDRRPDRRLVAVGRARRRPGAQPERRPPHRPDHASPSWATCTRTCCSSPARSGTRWSTSCRRPAKTAFGKQKRDRQFDRTWRYIDDLKAVARLPDRRPAVLPGRRAVAVQRHLRRRGQHLPRPVGLPERVRQGRRHQRRRPAARQRRRR